MALRRDLKVIFPRLTVDFYGISTVELAAMSFDPFSLQLLDLFKTDK